MSRFIPDYGDTNDPETRAKYGYLEAGVGISGNFAIFTVKFLIGVLTGSVSMLADSFHTMSDAGTSLIVVIGFKVASKEPDEGHPFGHGRYEYIATLIIAVVLALVGFEILYDAFMRFLDPPDLVLDGLLWIALAVLVATMVAKELMARYSFLLGRKIDSRMLEADAWHHRSDALTNIGVIIAIISSYYGYPIVDPIVGILISMLLVYTAVKFGKESCDLLVGRPSEKEKMDGITSVILGIDGVEGVHDIFVHDYGPRKIVSCHICVDRAATTEMAHSVVRNVEDAVKAIVPNSDTVVHVDPSEDSCSPGINRSLVKVLKRHPEIVGYHHVTRSLHGEGGHLHFHAVVRKGMSVEEAHQIIHVINDELKSMHPGYRVDIHVEPCGEECGACRKSECSHLDLDNETD